MWLARSNVILLARGREARRGGIRRLTFELGHGTPYAERLTNAERVLTTALQDRAAQAYGLGIAVPVAPCLAPLTLGMEEHVRIHPSAGAIELPLPQNRNWPGQCLPK